MITVTFQGNADEVSHEIKRLFGVTDCQPAKPASVPDTAPSAPPAPTKTPKAIEGWSESEPEEAPLPKKSKTVKVNPVVKVAEPEKEEAEPEAEIVDTPVTRQGLQALMMRLVQAHGEAISGPIKAVISEYPSTNIAHPVAIRLSDIRDEDLADVFVRVKEIEEELG